MIDATNHAEMTIAVRFDMVFEVIVKLKVFIAQLTSSQWIQSISVNLRDVFLLLILVTEDFFAEFAFVITRSLLLDVLVNAFVMSC